MPKNLVLCCDGTANEFAKDRTNVVKLFFTLDRDPARQVAYYHPGLGTMEPPGTLTRATRIATRLAGQAFGYGLEADIRDAYIFLMNNFEEGDRVFLFGFSRGAYTARAVASLLRMYGLIPRGNEALVPYAIRMLMAIHTIGDKNGRRSAKALFHPCRRLQEHLFDTGLQALVCRRVGYREFGRLVRKSVAASLHER
jgi:uncharacterized protein (DUF2235 family)